MPGFLLFEIVLPRWIVVSASVSIYRLLEHISIFCRSGVIGRAWTWVLCSISVCIYLRLLEHICVLFVWCWIQVNTHDKSHDTVSKLIKKGHHKRLVIVLKTIRGPQAWYRVQYLYVNSLNNNQTQLQQFYHHNRLSCYISSVPYDNISSSSQTWFSFFDYTFKTPYGTVREMGNNLTS